MGALVPIAPVPSRQPSGRDPGEPRLSAELESSGAGMNTHAGAGRVAEVEEPAVVEGEGCAASGRQTSLRGESN